jgi:methionyl aminopeptidase
MAIVLRSKREITKMRAAGLLVWEAHQCAGQLVKPGVTTRELDAVVDRLFAQRHAEPLFKGVPGPIPFPAATCISVNEEIVHGIPGDRELREGDIVSLDTGCRLNGWCGDAAVTYLVGECSDLAKHLLATTLGALNLAIELLPVKSRWSEIAREVQQFVTDGGLEVIDTFVGHGIGREMHEPPQVPNFVDLDSWEDFELRPGLVLAIEPMVCTGSKEVICRDDHWTQATRDGGLAAHCEHTVALTSEGPMILTEGPTSEIPTSEVSYRETPSA